MEQVSLSGLIAHEQRLIAGCERQSRCFGAIAVVQLAGLRDRERCNELTSLSIPNFCQHRVVIAARGNPLSVMGNSADAAPTCAIGGVPATEPQELISRTCVPNERR